MEEMSKFKTPVMVLMSGGLDSSTCLAYYHRNHSYILEALFIDFGQPAAKMELLACIGICAQYRTPLRTLNLGGVDLENDGFIQGRNAFFLSTALLAFGHRSGIIAIGVHSGTNYIDCGATFIDQMQSVFDSYTDGRILIDAPFLTWMKSEIWDFALEISLPVKETYSCERGTSPACGECLSCGDRRVLYA